MKQYRCYCCGYMTLDARGDFDICPVCFWEDETYFDFSKQEAIVGHSFDSQSTADALMDVPSGANHGLTLRAAQENYRLFGACEREMLPHVRKPYQSEK